MHLHHPALASDSVCPIGAARLHALQVQHRWTYFQQRQAPGFWEPGERAPRRNQGLCRSPTLCHRWWLWRWASPSTPLGPIFPIGKLTIPAPGRGCGTSPSPPAPIRGTRPGYGLPGCTVFIARTLKVSWRPEFESCPGSGLSWPSCRWLSGYSACLSELGISLCNGPLTPSPASAADPRQTPNPPCGFLRALLARSHAAGSWQPSSPPCCPGPSQASRAATCWHGRVPRLALPCCGDCVSPPKATSYPARSSLPGSQERTRSRSQLVARGAAGDGVGRGGRLDRVSQLLNYSTAFLFASHSSVPSAGSLGLRSAALGLTFPQRWLRTQAPGKTRPALPPWGFAYSSSSSSWPRIPPGVGVNKDPSLSSKMTRHEAL